MRLQKLQELVATKVRYIITASEAYLLLSWLLNCMALQPSPVLLPGFEAVSGTVESTGEIKQAQPCRQDAYCPGIRGPESAGVTPSELGYIPCPNNRWTVNRASISVDQCSKLLDILQRLQLSPLTALHLSLQVTGTD